MAWEVILWEDVESWLLSLDDVSYDLVAAAIDHLAAVGPTLGRPLVEQTAYRLREIREQQGLTQAEVAERMGLTQPTISALESGDLSRSGLATLHAYITALGGTVELTAAFGDQRLIIAT